MGRRVGALTASDTAGFSFSPSPACTPGCAPVCDCFAEREAAVKYSRTCFEASVLPTHVVSVHVRGGHVVSVHVRGGHVVRVRVRGGHVVRVRVSVRVRGGHVVGRWWVVGGRVMGT